MRAAERQLLADRVAAKDEGDALNNASMTAVVRRLGPLTRQVAAAAADDPSFLRV